MPAWLGVLTLCVGIGGMFLMPWARRSDCRDSQGEEQSISPSIEMGSCGGRDPDDRGRNRPQPRQISLLTLATLTAP